MGDAAGGAVTIEQRAARLAARLTGIPQHRVHPDHVDAVAREIREAVAQASGLYSATQQNAADARADIEQVRDAFMAGRRPLLDERARRDPRANDGDDPEVAFQHYLRTLRPAAV